MADRHARLGGERLARLGDGLRVAIHQQQAAAGAEARQHGAGVTAASKRAIEITPACLHGKALHRFVQHYRDVPQLGHAAPPVP